MYAIDVKNLTKYYRDVKAVDGINFQVEKGELFGFLGVNGAGKSTTINLLCTLFHATKGSATICGHELGKEDEAIRRKIGIVYQKDCLDELLSVKDNLLIRGAMYEKNKQVLMKQLDHVVDVLSLEEVLHRPFEKLSGGQKRRCEIARALMHAPEILFLDEPTTGLDPATRKVVWQCIDTLRKEFHMTVFLTTHYMEEAANANHIAIIDHGHILDYGTPFDLKNKYAKDRLLLYPKDDLALCVALQTQTCEYHKVEQGYEIMLSSTLDALDIVTSVKESVSGFEVVQGTMDDVFLNVTGRDLKKGGE